MAETETKEATQEETAELLVELYSEEIPWRLQEPMARNLEKFLREELAKALGLKNVEDVVGEQRVYWTPRRVAVGMFDIPVRSKAWEEERKGPKVSSPQVAIEGFLRANGLSKEQCQEKEGYLTFVVKHAALSTSDLLGEVVVRVIGRMAKELPVSMRFGRQRFRWVRPLRHIMAVFAGEGVKGELELGGEEKLTFTNETRGHPFAAPEALVVTGIQDYEDKLRKNYVEPSYQKRLSIIEQELGENQVIHNNKNLVEENACLVEFPNVLKGYFEENFLESLPSFLIDTVLNEHQKMIRSIDQNSKKNKFFIVTNIPSIKDQETIVEIGRGFERVVQARLSDAKFALKRDMEKTIDEHIENLQHITFHPRLGTIVDKNKRIQKLFPIIVENILENNKEDKTLKQLNKKEKNYEDFIAKEIEKLKSDLATETVREFPELQGKIKIYLTHFMDRFHEGDKVEYTIKNLEDFEKNTTAENPTLVAIKDIATLADNIDSLVTLWCIGEEATGSSDPFGLRRSFGNIFTSPIIKEKNLCLERILEEAENIIYQQIKIKPENEAGEINYFAPMIVQFMFSRLLSFHISHNIRRDCFEAIQNQNYSDNIKRQHDNTIALNEEIKNNNPLAEIFYRLHAILHHYSGDFTSSSSFFTSPPNPNFFSVAEEKDLHARAKQFLVDEAWQNLTFTQKLQTLGSLKDVVDPFFDHVLVMHDDKNIRQNRLRLLYSIYRRFLELADFTKIHHKDKQQKDKQQKNKQRKQP